MRRRLTAFILALVLLCSLAGSASAKQVPFNDVPPGSWYYDYVASACENGLIAGVSPDTFAPDSEITLAAAVTLAARMNQLWVDGNVTLKNGSSVWYSTYVDYVRSRGLLNTTAYEGHWDDPATRAEFAMIFSSALPESCYAAINRVDDGAIPDVMPSDTCGPAVYKLYRAGILTGSTAEHSFLPDDSITRAEVSAVLARMFDSSLRVRFVLAGVIENPYDTVQEGSFLLRNEDSGHVLGVSALLDRGSVLPVSPAKGTFFRVVWQEETGWYTITANANAKLALNQNSSKPRIGTAVNLYSVDGADTQGWYFERIGSQWIIRSAYNDQLVLAERQGSVILVAYRYGDNTQRWTLHQSADGLTDPDVDPGGNDPGGNDPGGNDPGGNDPGGNDPGGNDPGGNTHPHSGEGGSAVLSDAEMVNIIAAVGTQRDDPTMASMCAAVCLTYIHYWKTGEVLHPIDLGGTWAQWSLEGGSGRGFDSDELLMARMKAEIDAGRPCVLHVAYSGGQHWLLFYRYTDDGTEFGDFISADPWDGDCERFDGNGYTVYPDRWLITFK